MLINRLIKALSIIYFKRHQKKWGLIEVKNKRERILSEKTKNVIKIESLDSIVII